MYGGYENIEIEFNKKEKDIYEQYNKLRENYLQKNYYPTKNLFG